MASLPRIFLAGIMAVYALSGTVLIFRDTDFLKIEKQIKKQIKPNLSNEDLGKAIRIQNIKITGVTGSTKYFTQGSYDTISGNTQYRSKALSTAIQKLTQLHKASTKQPLFFLNIFFAASLLFFVISSFWMFMPKTTIFKKGLYFTLAGIVLTVILLWVG